ncbi:LLM class flavin-dependent oxidoreductase [Gordonia soli]|uniref:Putative FMNH2-dependent monooxygenase n=1 Tax=Gordonia soli NBRC 108243 TaxID=1223545 RepID=M0QH17_9ACTN|nr:LLM class flavin-dependent oxidoreductase [Gordonia soli]GAC67838.1 putative FMNH2-dependent monooxygenase [Gordonia soli NBRC 108243]
MSDRPLYFSAFVMNTPSHVLHGLWRKPEAQNHQINSLEHWIELARYVDRVGFDLLFFADVTGLRSPWNGNYELVAREGLQIPVNDPSTLISALAAATEDIGLVFTSSIVQALPFDFARRLSTLDHYTRGRVGWNIVTSFSDNTYRNFGHDKLVEHDERYRIAAEYVDTLYKLWEGSWDEDALVQDKEAGVYADPAKIHKINHVGQRFSVEGPHLVSPSPQRTPFLFQAGASPAGQAFSARNAEGVFIGSPDPQSARGLIAEQRAQAVAVGRGPSDIRFFQGLSFVVGETEDEARAKEAAIEEYSSLEGILSHILGDAGIDAGGLDLDTPIDDLGEFRGVQGWRRWAEEAAGSDRPTIGHLARVFERASRIVGTPEQIADRLEEWRDAGIDGVNVFHATRPGTFVEIGELLFPELRRRGLLSTDKSGTLRSKLSGGGSDRLPDTHPAAAYRGAFTDNNLLDTVTDTAAPLRPAGVTV